MVGQKILVKTHNLSSSINKEIKKFFLIFDGPYDIIKMIGENTVLAKHVQSGVETKITWSI